MIHNLRPDFIAPSVLHVTPDFLSEQGIKTLSTDVDGFLMSHHGSELPEEVRRHLQAVSDSGVNIVFSSNAYGERVDELHTIAATIDDTVRVVTPAMAAPLDVSPKKYRKPNPAVILKAAGITGVHPSEILHGGDQGMKDVLAANRAGAKSLLVPKYGEGGDWRVEILQRPLEAAALPLVGVRGLRKVQALTAV